MRATALLRCVEFIVCSRNGVEKYTEKISSITLALFSVHSALIPPFYTYILRHWPKGFSEKTLSLITFLEQLLSASPPLYLTPFLVPITIRLFKQLCAELLGSQVEISKRVAYFLQNYYILNNYIAMDEQISTIVKVALTKGSRKMILSAFPYI